MHSKLLIAPPARLTVILGAALLVREGEESLAGEDRE